MAFGFGDGGGGPTRADAGKPARDAGLPGHAAGAAGRSRRLLQGIWKTPRAIVCRPGTASCISNTIAAPTPPRAATSAPTANRSSCCTTPSSWRRWPRCSTPTMNYPSDTFRDAWRLICLNQFHDIIPGIERQRGICRFERCNTQQIAEMGTAARDEALKALASKIGGDVVIVNPTSFRAPTWPFWRSTHLRSLALVSGDGDTSSHASRPTAACGSTQVRCSPTAPTHCAYGRAQAHPAEGWTYGDADAAGKRLCARRTQRRRRYHTYL